MFQRRYARIIALLLYVKSHRIGLHLLKQDTESPHKLNTEYTRTPEKGKCYGRHNIQIGPVSSLPFEEVFIILNCPTPPSCRSLANKDSFRMSPEKGQCS